MRAKNARVENTVRTQFQKYHGPSKAALASASTRAGALESTAASSWVIGTFTTIVRRKPPPM